MQRIIALVLMTLVLPAAAFALDLTVGPRVAVGSYQIYGDDVDDFMDNPLNDGKRGLGLSAQVGAFAEIELMPMVAVQPELLFSYGRPQLKDDDVSYTYKAPTIDLPVLVKGKFEAGSLGVNVFAGPVVQMKVGTWKTVFDDGSNETESDIDDKEIRKFVFGAIAGGGVEIPGLGPGHLMIDARVQINLTTFDDTGDFEAKGRALLVGVGYGIDLM